MRFAVGSNFTRLVLMGRAASSDTWEAPHPAGAADILTPSCMPEISDPHETLGVRRDASLAEIRIAYRRSTQILAPERFANASETVRAEAERRLSTLHTAMEAIEHAHGGEASSLGSLGTSASATIAPPIPVPPPTPKTTDRDLRVTPAPDPVAQRVVEAPAATPAEPEPAPVESPAEAVETAPALAETPPPAPAVSTAIGTEDYTRERYLPSATRSAKFSATQRRLAAGALVLSVLALAAIWLFNSSGGSTNSSNVKASNASFSFEHPATFGPRTPPTGSKQPIASAAFGLDNQNYVVVATYRTSFDVKPDGSAVSAGGATLTADRLAASVKVAVRDIAKASGLTAGGQQQDAKLGSVPATSFSYAATDNSRNTTYLIGFLGKTQLYLACASTPKHADEIASACDKAASSFALR